MCSSDLPPSRRRAVVWFGVGLAALWIAPVAIFGPHLYGALLRDWYVAMHRVATTYSEFYYFPGQSIRGLLLRWLTPVAPALSYFPRINIASLDPKIAIYLWIIIAGLLYGTFALWMLRSDVRTLWMWDAVAFVIYSMIEPYAVKSGLISLAPAVITAGCVFSLVNRSKTKAASGCWANRLFVAAAALSLFQAMLQYKPWQQYLLSFGMDFWGECLLLTAFVLWIQWAAGSEGLELQNLGQAADRSGHAAGLFGLTTEREELPTLTRRA